MIDWGLVVTIAGTAVNFIGKLVLAAKQAEAQNELSALYDQIREKKEALQSLQTEAQMKYQQVEQLRANISGFTMPATVAYAASFGLGIVLGLVVIK